MLTEDRVREIAREEAHDAIASLSGLVMRRLQEEHPTRSMERNAMEDVLDERLSEIFGEALQQFSRPAQIHVGGDVGVDSDLGTDPEAA